MKFVQKEKSFAIKNVDIMKRLVNIGLLLLGFCFGGCNSEDDLTPSGYEKNWMVIGEPTTDDPVDKIRYELYRDYGVSTYYNDTIGQEERIDMNGTPYTYYEVLRVFYAPGNKKPDGDYDLLPDHSVLESVLNYFREHVFGRFESCENMPAFLFVDTVWTSVDVDYRKPMDAYVGYNTMVVYTERDFGTFSDVEKKAYAVMFLSNYFSGILGTSTHAEWEEEFLGVSKSLNPSCQYLYSISLTYGTAWADAFVGTSFTEKEELGFISSITVEDYWYGTYEATPTEDLDKLAYVEAVLTYTTAEFEAMYEQYDAVMQKFHMMKEKIQELGFQTLD